MNPFANLPGKNNDGQVLPVWDGLADSIPDLLKSRKEIVADNWFIQAPALLGNTLGSRPVVRQFKKNLRSIGQQLIADEVSNQAVFVAEVQKEFRKRLTYAQGASQINEWDRSRKVLKLEKNFSGSGIPGMPA